MEKLIKLSDVEEMIKSKLINTQGWTDLERQNKLYIELLSSISLLPTQNEWISVEEKIPDDYCMYLCRTEDGKYCFSPCIQGYSCEEHGNTNNHFADGITHYMPLPLPPNT